MFVVLLGTARTGVAHVTIGFTGYRHRHVSVVSLALSQARYRASPLSGLYHSFAARADFLKLALCRYGPVDGRFEAQRGHRADLQYSQQATEKLIAHRDVGDELIEREIHQPQRRPRAQHAFHHSSSYRIAGRSIANSLLEACTTDATKAAKRV